MGGLDSVPGAGEEFSVWSSEQDAREAAETFQFQQRSQVIVCVYGTMWRTACTCVCVWGGALV